MSGGQKQTDCSSFQLLHTDPLEMATTGETGLRYDSAGDQFIYNYKAPSTMGCYIFAIRKADGLNTKQVDFRFTR